jgi:hypothetical protein
MTDSQVGPKRKSAIRIKFANLHLDRERIESWNDTVLGVVADFQITVDDSIIYREVEFPVIELAYRIHRWLLCSNPSDRDLEYESMESAENPLIWFRQENDHWVIGAAHQLRLSGAVRLQDVESGSREFLTELEEAVRIRLGMSLFGLLLADERHA